MGVLGSEVSHLFKVLDAGGNAVTGLVDGQFTKDLKRWDSGTGSLVADAATVTVTETDAIGDPGRYRAAYTPNTAAGLHVLTVTEPAPMTALGLVREFQEIVADMATVFGTAGPFLSTRERFRQMADIRAAGAAAGNEYTDAHEDDDRIDQLLDQVTTEARMVLRQNITQQLTTERQDGRAVRQLVIGEQPVIGLVSVHETQDEPRLYDATTLLVEDTDYLLDDAGVLHRLAGCVWLPGPNTVQVKAVTGWEIVPPDIERAAQEAMLVKLQKAKDRLYHVQREQIGEGVVEFLMQADWPESAARVMARYARSW